MRTQGLSLRQKGFRSVDEYMDEAKRLYQPFINQVINAVAAAAAQPGGGAPAKVMSNLKGKFGGGY